MADKNGEKLYEEAEMAYKNGQEEKAIELFKKVLELDPTFALAHNDLAFIYWKKGNLEKALYHVTKAIESAPGKYEEAEMAYKNGQEDKAIGLFNQVLELDPSFALAHNDLAFIYWEKGNVEKSLYHITKAMELAPDDGDVIWNCGQIMINLGYLKEAYEVYSHYLNNHPEDEEVKHVLQQLEEKLGL